jgi:hypothetical protein
MKVGIVGSRTITNYETIKEVLDKTLEKDDVIISGGASGVDSLAEMYARLNNLSCEVYKAEWDNYGKSAGFIRNSKIVEESDYIIAFWDGISKGTLDTIKKAENVGKQVIKIIVSGSVE